MLFTKAYGRAYIPNEEKQQGTAINKLTAQQQYQCRWCLSSFNKDKYLQEHRKRHTTTTGRVAFIPGAASVIEEEKRQKNIIKAERQHQCEWCGEGFNSDHHLQEHRQLHTTTTGSVAYIFGAAFVIEEEKRQKKFCY